MEEMGLWWSFLAGFVAGLILVVGHYVLRQIHQGKEVHSLWRHIYGTVTLNVCFGVWLLTVQPALGTAVIGLWIITIVAGGFDMLAYVVDHFAPAVLPAPLTPADKAELESRRAAEGHRYPV